MVSSSDKRLAPMKKLLPFVFALTVIVGHPASALQDVEKVARVAFANEFIRELSSAQQIREMWEKDHAADASASAQMATAIRTSTRAKLELQTNIGMLENMHLDSSMDFVRLNLEEIYKTKIAIHNEQIGIASAFIGGPKDNVDYDALSARPASYCAK
jgi:hypothetical protein